VLVQVIVSPLMGKNLRQKRSEASQGFACLPASEKRSGNVGVGSTN
jgi:hypothetical protein